MAPLSLAAKLHAALPWVSPQARAILTSLASWNGSVGSADHLARLAALRSRFQLARLLRRDGLPPLRELVPWTRVLHWLHRFETDGSALGRLAASDGVDPASASRLVRRILGANWTTARTRGFQSAFDQFVGMCRRPRLDLLPGTRKPATRRPGPRVRSPGRAFCDVCAPRPLQESRAPEITARVPLGGQPFSVGVSRYGVAYVTCGHAALVQCLDLDRASTGRSIPVGSVPTCVAFRDDGRRAYVTNQFSETIGVIDVRTYRQIDEIDVPGDPVPLLLGSDPNALYVTTNQDVLLALDLPSRRVTRRLSLPATSHHLALHPDGRRLYVATRAAGMVLEVGLERFSVLRRFALGGMPQSLVIAQDGTRLLVANEGGTLQSIDLLGGRIVQEVELGSGAFELALSSREEALYVGLPAAGLIRILDAGTLVHRGAIRVGGVPRGLAFDAGWKRLIAVNEAGWVDLVRPVRGKGSAPGSRSSSAA